MQSLTMLPGSELKIGKDIRVRLIDVRGGRVRLGFAAPGDVSIYRKEIYLRIQDENRKRSRRRVSSRSVSPTAFGKAAAACGVSAVKASRSKR